MPTDDERREVAARLRELDYADLQESLICAYLDALGIEGYADWVGIAHRLADLIEPPTQCPYYRSDRHYCSIHDVSAIDHNAILALAKVLDGMGDRYNEHERYELGTTFKAIVGRIREACGEVVG